MPSGKTRQATRLVELAETKLWEAYWLAPVLVVKPAVLAPEWEAYWTASDRWLVKRVADRYRRRGRPQRDVTDGLDKRGLCPRRTSSNG